jgi:hypothetical protein
MYRAVGHTDSFVEQRPVGAYSKTLPSRMWKMLLQPTHPLVQFAKASALTYEPDAIALPEPAQDENPLPLA